MDRQGPGSLAVVLLCAAAAWAFGPREAPGQVVQKKAQIQLGAAAGVARVRFAAASDGEQKPEEITHTVFQQPKREVLQWLSQARQLLAAGQTSDAVVLLQEILNGPEDYFFQPDKDSPVRLSLKREAERLIGSMAREGRQIYELRCRDKAPPMLQKAVAAGDPQGLAEVSRRFFHTQAGYEATLLLGLDHLDHTRPLAGALTLRRLMENCADADQFEPTLSLAMATCWVRSGMPGEAQQVLARLKRTQGRSVIQIGGKQVAWFTSDADALAWLGELTGPQASGGPAQPEQWTMLRGNPSRTAVSSGGAPLLNMRWRVPVSDHPLVEQMIRQIKQDYEDQGVPSLPGLHPLVVGDLVLMRTARNLLAIDFTTGKRVWEIPVSDPLETLLGYGDSRVAVGHSSQLQMGLAQRVWQDATYGTMSSDGRYVFSVEDLGVGIPLGGSRHIVINGRRQTNPAWPKPYNRLAAHDIRTGKLKWHVGGGAEEFKLPLSGAFFLGPPMPLMGQLYVLAEIKYEIRLLALDAKSGELIWSQQLAPVEPEINNRGLSLRRLTGVSPSYADGILVCPTSTGAIVAVDLATRSLLWGYPYAQESQGHNRSQMIAMRMGMMVRPDQTYTGRWANTTTILAEGRVLVTPPESEHLHCLNLVDGRLLWKKPREEALYVACVHHGNVVLVARRDVRALNVADGEAAWEGRKVELPEGAVPSGQGFAGGSQYFVPLSTAEVAAIDLDAGKIAHLARSRQGNVPGNLVCYQGRVISQGPDGLEIFYQLGALRKLAESRLAANPADPEALALRGEILLDQGKRPEAIVTLRRSLELASDPRTRDLLRDAMFEGLKTDFTRHRGMTEEMERLIDDPVQRARYLRLMAAGFEAAGELPAALEHYLKLVDVEADQHEPAAVSKVLSVRRDRWIQARLAGLRDGAPSEFRPQIDRAVEARLQAAIKTGTAESLKRFLHCFGNQAAADQARRELVALLVKSKHLLEAELLLRQKERSGDPARVASAVAETAELLRGAGRADDAAVYYRRLAGELADVVCLDGKTGRQLVEALEPEGDVARLLGAAPAWPVGRVDVKAGTPTPARRTYHGRFVLSYDGSPRPFFSDTTVLFDQNRRMLLANDALGKERWKPVSMLKPGTNPNLFLAHNRGLTRASVEGHLLVLSMGAMIQAFDTLGSPAGEGPRLIWSQNLTDSGIGNLGMGQMGGLRGINLFQIQQMRWARHHRGRNSALGPVTDDFVCFQRLRHLSAVDSVTGQTLWTRSDVPPGSELFGDSQHVFAVPPDQPYAMVIRALDGKLLGKRDLPKFELTGLAIPDEPADEDEIVREMPFRQYCIATLGRNLLIWRPDGQQHKLALFDLWQQKDVWQARNFDAGAKYALVGHEAIGVLEPNGHFVLVSLPDGRTMIESTVRPEPSLVGIYVLHLQDQYFLVAHSPQRPGTTVRPSQPLPGTLYGPIASGRVYAFDAQGKVQWPKPVEVERQQVLLSQPSRLPVLTFASQVYQRRSNGSGSYHVSVLCIDKRTGRKVCEEKFANSTGIFELYGDPEKKTVDVVTQRNRVTMTFTGEPLPPETEERKETEKEKKKEPPSIGSAIFKALEKAIGEEPAEEETKLVPAVPVPRAPQRQAPAKPAGKKAAVEKPAVEKPAASARAAEKKKEE